MKRLKRSKLVEVHIDCPECEVLQAELEKLKLDAIKIEAERNALFEVIKVMLDK